MNLTFDLLALALFAGFLAVVAAALFSLLKVRNMLGMLIATEVMTKGVTLLLICAGYLNGNTALTQTFIVTIIVIEAVVAVVAVGLAVSVHRNTGSLDIANLNKLNG